MEPVFGNPVIFWLVLDDGVTLRRCLAHVVSTADDDPDMPAGCALLRVCVAPMSLDGVGITASPQVVPLLDAPPGDGSPGFVRAS